MVVWKNLPTGGPLDTQTYPRVNLKPPSEAGLLLGISLGLRHCGLSAICTKFLDYFSVLARYVGCWFCNQSKLWILSDSCGSLQIPADNPCGSLWIPSDPCGSHQIPLDPIRSLCIPSDPVGSHQIHLDPIRSIWIPSDPFGSHQIHLDPIRSLWIPAECQPRPSRRRRSGQRQHSPISPLAALRRLRPRLTQVWPILVEPSLRSMVGPSHYSGTYLSGPSLRWSSGISTLWYHSQGISCIHSTTTDKGSLRKKKKFKM